MNKPTHFNEDLERSVLGIVIWSPDLVPILARRVDPTHFFTESAREVYCAMLAVWNTGKPLSIVLVWEQLRITGKLAALGLQGPSDYVGGGGDAMLEAHIDTLLELAEKRANGESADLPDFNEYQATQLFLARMQPFQCIGSQWFVYRDGAFEPTSRDTFRPISQSVIPHLQRTERRERAILNHAEGARQVAEDSLRGFYYQDGSRTLINCANGVLCIEPDKLPQLRPHDPGHRFTLRTAAAFVPEAGCGRFAALVAEALPDAADGELLQMLAGSFLLPDSRFEAAGVCYGAAGTGKSTLGEGIATALGELLVTRLTMSQLCDPKGYHLPSLRHAAVNLGTELDSLEVEDGGVFKALVSGEPIQARAIYGAPFVMRTSAKLLFLSNDLPRFKNGTDGELRRMRFLRFDLKPARPDTTLKNQLAAERDGIFAWMVSGLLSLLRAGQMPQGGEHSLRALDRFAVNNDPVASFISGRCELTPHAIEEKTHIVEAYGEYLDDNGLPETLKASFLRHLYARFPRVRSVRGVGRHDRRPKLAGIRIKEAA